MGVATLVVLRLTPNHSGRIAGQAAQHAPPAAPFLSNQRRHVFLTLKSEDRNPASFLPLFSSLSERASLLKPTLLALAKNSSNDNPNSNAKYKIGSFVLFVRELGSMATPLL
jgi:hypothetical protein